ncbi:MAG: PaaI family thioesterase [Actinobacteria bacterium]|nr:PaaI family thioesterase [Actinomycetota bacterium]MCL5025367.1 PaaI family thioesterase [Chloroflexota bacterium]
MIADQYAELATRFNDSPYARLMGMRVTELSRGHAKIKMALRDEHRNWASLIHGGVIMSLADQAFGCATNTLDRVYVAVQFSISLLAAPGPGDTLVAEGRVLHAGRTTGMAEMTVHDETGRLVAKATGTVVGIGERR